MGSKIQLVVWVGGIQEGKSLGDIIAYKQVRILRDWDDVRNHAGDFVDEVATCMGRIRLPNMRVNRMETH